MGLVDAIDFLWLFRAAVLLMDQMRDTKCTRHYVYYAIIWMLQFSRIRTKDQPDRACRMAKAGVAACSQGWGNRSKDLHSKGKAISRSKTI